MDNLKALQAFSFKGSILAIANSDEHLYVLDNFLIFYKINKKDRKIEQKTVLKKLDKQVHYSDKSLSISNSGFIAFSLPNSTVISIVAIDKKFKILKKLQNHESNKIQVTKFSKNSKILVTSAADGRVFFYNHHLDIVANIVPQPDYTSAIEFSNDSKYCCISFFHKKSVIWDINSLNQLKVISTNDVVEDSAFHDESIILAVRDGSLVKNNFKDKNDPKKLQLPSWPMTIETFPKLEIAVVGCKDSFLYFVNIESMSQISKIKFESPVTHLQFEGEYLYIYMQSGDMLLFDTETKLEDIQIALAAQNYQGVKDCFDANPFLYLRSELVNSFNDAWEQELQKALAFIKDNQMDRAMEVVKPFLDDQKRKEQFEVYLNMREEISRFLESVKKNEFKKAYDLANKYAFIRKTKVYEELEFEWNKYFNAAKKLLQESPNNVNKAENILKPFSLVETKRSVIKEMLKNYELFTVADKKIKEKDFIGYFELCKKHQFLKDTLVYKKTMEYAKIVQDRVNTLMQTGQYDKAYEGATLLASFDGYEDIAIGIQDRVEVMKQFIEYTKADDIEAASKLVDANYYLESTVQFQRIVKKFNLLYERLYEIAKNGQTKLIKQELDLYLDIKYFDNKVASLFRISYFQELTSMLHDNELWLESVKSYIQYFGYDTQLDALFDQRSIEKSEIAHIKELEFKFKPVEYKDSIYSI
jgi:hypothetical protein